MEVKKAMLRMKTKKMNSRTSLIISITSLLFHGRIYVVHTGKDETTCCITIRRDTGYMPCAKFPCMGSTQYNDIIETRNAHFPRKVSYEPMNTNITVMEILQ